jgi:hypothetical protein
MGKLADALAKAKQTRKDRDPKFVEQLETYKKFKDRMKEAGIEYGDKFSIPLMSRLGHTVKSK